MALVGKVPEEIKILRWGVEVKEGGVECDPRSHQRQHHNPKHCSIPPHSHPEVQPIPVDFRGVSIVIPNLNLVGVGTLFSPKPTSTPPFSVVLSLPSTPDIYPLQSFIYYPQSCSLLVAEQQEKLKGVLVDAKTLEIS